MKLNWTTLKERKPKSHGRFDIPFIACVVYACNPSVKIGGVIQTCRWDIKNNSWLKSDIECNWYLQKPYQITHFSDDIETPYEPAINCIK